MEQPKYGIIHLKDIIIEPTTQKSIFRSEYSNYINDDPFINNYGIITLPSNNKSDLDMMKIILNQLPQDLYIIHVIGNKYISMEVSNLRLYEIIFIDNFFNKYIFRTNEFCKVYDGKHKLVNNIGEITNKYNYILSSNNNDVSLTNNTIDIIKSINGSTYKIEYDSQYKIKVNIKDILYEDIFRANKNPLYKVLEGIEKLDKQIKKEKEFYLFNEYFIFLSYYFFRIFIFYLHHLIKIFRFVKTMYYVIKILNKNCSI